jgi:poly(beta-D-mannuronate) lyase
MMVKTLLIGLTALCSLQVFADTTRVGNLDELQRADRMAKPGDLIILRDGEWKDVGISLTCRGTREKPIIFRAETPGKMHISGNSHLNIAGTHIVVDGWRFANGYAGRDAVISFRRGKDAVAENCRVTNTVIDGFNNPARLEENQWVALYGKHNRVDHCSFVDKRNIGVLLAVMLDDDRSRSNFHVVEDNYFGLRVPLASNGGEIIRVGLSEHCQYNSNTLIRHNLFEQCDGEAEVISIKSCSNTIRGNVFKECQGSVVLRHGDYNTVEDNLFFGNGKPGTGGVRIINKGQWVVNNYFSGCMGAGFRSPLCIMNGVPNSPPIRYVEVSDAVIANNTFFECTPISLGEGSDAERSVAPHDVDFINNLFFASKAASLAVLHDDMSRIRFHGNILAGGLTGNIAGDGFRESNVSVIGKGAMTLPMTPDNIRRPVSDSIIRVAASRIKGALSNRPGVSDADILQQVSGHASNAVGARWFERTRPVARTATFECRNAEELSMALANGRDAELVIWLTGDDYVFDAPVTLTGKTVLSTKSRKQIRFSLKGGGSPFLIHISAGSTLSIKDLSIELGSLNSRSFLSTDTTGPSGHSSLSIHDCSFQNMNGIFLNGARSSVSDSIVVVACRFEGMKGPVFRFDAETDQKGYYNVERMRVSECRFADGTAPILTMLRSGKDESTLGPDIQFDRNQMVNCNSGKASALLSLSGVQYSRLEGNAFTGCNTDATLVEYRDWVKATHHFRQNLLQQSGSIRTNAYVTME